MNSDLFILFGFHLRGVSKFFAEEIFQNFRKFLTHFDLERPAIDREEQNVVADERWPENVPESAVNRVYSAHVEG